MKIYDIIEKFKLNYLYLTDKDKEYVFTCLEDNAIKLEQDFIFIPFITNKAITELLLSVSKNTHCKGFILNDSFFNLESQFFHSFMRKYSKNFEVILHTKNYYNFVAYYTRYKAQIYNFDSIVIAGTKETSTIKEIIAKSFNKANINASYILNNNYCWQRLYEPLLMANKDDKYVIIEAIPEKVYLMSSLKIKNKHIIYSKSSISGFNNFNNIEELSDELIRIIEDEEHIKSIFSYESNELVNNYIAYKYQDKLHLATEVSVNEFQQNFEYLKRCYSISDKFLRYIGIDTIPTSEFLEEEKLYDNLKINERNSFILNNNKINLENIKKTIPIFSKKNENTKKCIILENINVPIEYQENYYSELYKYLSQYNIDTLILLNLNKYNYLYRKYNNSTYIKNFKYNSNLENSKIELNNFIKSLSKQNYSFYIATKQEVFINEI